MSFSFFSAFSFEPILFSLIGAAAGIIWGALPGLSMTMGMALLAQFSYSMDIHDSCAFLMGVYTGASFGGTVSAVLLNIPGTPDSVPVQIAGYPLTKQGRGGEAMATAILASFMGNWFGILVLVLLTPVLLSFALSFGAWEQFLLAVWGILVAGSISGEGDSAIKGWISGWIGLGIAMVGSEPIHAFPRMTFDIPELRGGIEFIPALIGLFGIAEVMRMAAAPSATVSTVVMGPVRPRVDLLIRYVKSAIRSSAIGTFIGIVPGGGAPMANFLSYEVGQRSSGKNFAKGSMEGVICCQTSDNAVIGGSLLPAMSLGIPSSAAIAVFMAALSYQGVIVGPAVEQSQPGFLNFLYGTLIVANVAMYILAFAMLKPSMRVLSTPPSILMPIVVVLCVVGSFALQLSSFDIYVAFIFGVAGYILYKWGFPLAPMVFAMILGQLADENLRKAFIIFQAESWTAVLTRPVGMSIIVIIILTIIYGFWKDAKSQARMATA
ncbi:tripartite tricarboxylate transporter permease [Microvirga aerophila]|uniref:Transporter n=1 Tax=Microvirga aerophila TaxID=670291 RepID=A0A512BXN1_9HYPH|nr:tripartite tricarboxylate transporter permease [Microvirga aerophila]GEO16711.1 transporter [Microvirga aerophila]